MMICIDTLERQLHTRCILIKDLMLKNVHVKMKINGKRANQHQGGIVSIDQLLYDYECHFPTL